MFRQLVGVVATLSLCATAATAQRSSAPLSARCGTAEAVSSRDTALVRKAIAPMFEWVSVPLQLANSNAQFAIRRTRFAQPHQVRIGTRPNV